MRELSAEELKLFVDLPHVHHIMVLMENVIKHGAEAYLKFTCLHCGSRQTMEKANAMYTSGECEECKGVSDFHSPAVELGILLHAGTPVDLIDQIFHG